MSVPLELRPPEGFRRLSLEDRAVLEPFLLASGRQSCEFAFTNLFLWSGTYRPDWCFIGSHLYLLLETEDILMFAPGGTRGPEPDELLAVSDRLIRAGYSGSFDHVDQEYLKTHPDVGTKFSAERMDDRYDEYIYCVDALVGLHGRLLAKKRNLIAQFREDYPDATLEPLSRANLDEALAVQRDWFAAQDEPVSVEAVHEAAAIGMLAEHFESLPAEGLVLRAGGRVVSFAVYSPVSSDLWTVHFEKTRYEYKGASQYITHSTAAALQGRARLLNREQDLGIPGLRQAKKSYDPLFMLQNYKLTRRS